MFSNDIEIPEGMGVHDFLGEILIRVATNLTSDYFFNIIHFYYLMVFLKGT